MFCAETYIKFLHFHQATVCFRIIRNMRNLSVVLLLLIFTFLRLNKSMETWKEKNYGFLDYGEFNNNFSEDKCADNEMCQNNFDELIKSKRRFEDIDQSPFRMNTNNKKSARLSTYYHSSRPMSCSCGIEFRILDLGHQYYPRYLHTGVCKSDICNGMYRCVEKHYKVRVLKQRDPRSPEIKTSISFPDNLKGIWQPEMITVTVACECSL